MDRPWLTHFLTAVAAGSSLSEAARAAGVPASTVYRLRKEDADFQAALADAEEESVDILETEARRRAVDGEPEPVLYQGQPTYELEYDDAGYPIYDTIQQETPGFNEKGEPIVQLIDVKRPRRKLDADGNPVVLTVRKRSDSLLTLLLKGRRKDVFADRKEITGKDGAPLPPQIVIATGVPSVGPSLDDLV